MVLHWIPNCGAAFEAANIAKQTEFEFGGDTYYIVEEGKEKAFGKAVPAALASKMIFDAASSDNSALVSSYEFRVAAEEAFLNGTRAFELNGANYVLEVDGAEDDSIIIDLMEGGNATHFATMSDLIINPSRADTLLPLSSGPRSAKPLPPVKRHLRLLPRTALKPSIRSAAAAQPIPCRLLC